MRNTVMAELKDEDPSVVCKDPVHSALLQFLKIDDFEEYEPDAFCTTQYNEIKSQTHTIKTRCNVSLSAHR